MPRSLAFGDFPPSRTSSESCAGHPRGRLDFSSPHKSTPCHPLQVKVLDADRALHSACTAHGSPLLLLHQHAPQESCKGAALLDTVLFLGPQESLLSFQNMGPSLSPRVPGKPCVATASPWPLGPTLQVLDDAGTLCPGDGPQHTEGGLPPEARAVLPETGGGDEQSLELVP